MNIIVIGLGSMGKRRIRILKAMYPDYEIYGVDSKQERTEEASKLYGMTCFASLEEAEHSCKITCAFVCTAPLAHATIISKCLEKGWNIFTEINLVSDGYEENIQMAKDKNLTLFLSSTPIYRAEMEKVREIMIDNKEAVNYMFHVGQYLPDWHPWEDFKQFFVGDKRTNGCREIFAIELPWMVKTFGNIESVNVISHKLSDLDIPYNDSYLVQIIHEGGTQGIFAADVVCRQAVRKLEVYNQQIYLEWNGKPETLKQKNLETGVMESICDDAYHNEKGYSEFVNEYAYVNEIKEFFEVLTKGKQALYSFEDDREVLKVIDQIEGN